jgi:transglutaminase-like putative cysteine protease
VEIGAGRVSRAPASVAGGAILALAAIAILAWTPIVARPATAALAAAVPAAFVLCARRPMRAAVVAVVLWLPAAALLAGVPADTLEPAAWPALLDGMWALRSPDLVYASNDPWPLAAVLAMVGAGCIAAAGLARRRPAMAFAVVAAPWAAALVAAGPDVAVWQGVAVLAAGLLWHAWPRTSPRAAVALTLVVAVGSAVVAEAAAPRDRWLALPELNHSGRERFRTLSTEPTFTSIADKRDGSVMLEIRAAAPASWRMQALDVFDGHTWRASTTAPQLPEPAAEPARIDVRVRELQNTLVVAPGRIDRIDAAATARKAPGGGWELSPPPQAGDVYRVDASVVRARGLREAGLPRAPGVAAYTRLGWRDRRPKRGPAGGNLWSTLSTILAGGITPLQPPGFPVQVPPFGGAPSPRAERALARSPYDRVAVLARRLAAGARTERDVVERVRRYLADERRFRYTTDVPPPGEYPLADFLLRTHAGYCQHFAGAAALLLRLAGVPARMVVGFATGVRTRDGFNVRDVDAHAWIEVYFEGHGWVPFDMTPASAEAVADGLDPAAHAGGPAAPARPPAGAILAVLAVAALAGGALRRRGRALEDALPWLAARSGMTVGSATTLGELRHELARAVGPHTSALAAQAERARFGPGEQPRPSFARTRVARAVALDVGSWRALALLVRRRSGDRLQCAHADDPLRSG